MAATIPASISTTSPAFAHSGSVARDGFEWSDVALFVVAALGVWLVRRSLRARFRRKD